MPRKGKTAEQLATEHWDWLEPIIRMLLDLEDIKTLSLLRYIYITSMEHGYKHAEDKK